MIIEITLIRGAAIPREVPIPCGVPPSPTPKTPRHLAARLRMVVLGPQVLARTLKTWPLEARRVNSRSTPGNAEQLSAAVSTIQCGRRTSDY